MGRVKRLSWGRSKAKRRPPVSVLGRNPEPPRRGGEGYESVAALLVRAWGSGNRPPYAPNVLNLQVFEKGGNHMPEPVDYKAVLADLRARREALDAAIAAIEPLASGAASIAGIVAGQGKVGNGDTIDPGAFHRLSVPEATKKYLGMTGRQAKTPKEIAAALNQGGQGKATYVNVYTALKRLRVSDEVTKLPNGAWGLASWYGKESDEGGTKITGLHGIVIP